jgi:hypothetical protein
MREIFGRLTHFAIAQFLERVKSLYIQIDSDEHFVPFAHIIVLFFSTYLYKAKISGWYFPDIF